MEGIELGRGVSDEIEGATPREKEKLEGMYIG